MKFLLASTVLALLASAPAFAADTTIFAANEAPAATNTAPAPAADADSISLEGFNGGVSTSDAHDGGGNGAMVIQMLMPNTAAAVTGTPGPFVARVAVSGGAK